MEDLFESILRGGYCISVQDFYMTFFGSAAQLSKRPGSVWNCLWRHALKRSPGIICKSRVSYPGPGFLSSATWSSLLKKHYNGLNQTNLCRKSTVESNGFINQHTSFAVIRSYLQCCTEKFFKIKYDFLSK